MTKDTDIYIIRKWARDQLWAMICLLIILIGSKVDYQNFFNNLEPSRFTDGIMDNVNTLWIAFWTANGPTIQRFLRRGQVEKSSGIENTPMDSQVGNPPDHLNQV